MVNQVFKFLHKTRYLLVAALVSALLSTPFSTEAESTSNIKLAVSDTISGESTEVIIANANSYNEIQIEVTKPNGEKLDLNISSDSSGEAKVIISGDELTRSGSYLASAKNLTKNSDFSKFVSFQVKPGDVSEEDSSIKLSKNTAKSGENIQAEVKLQDSFGNPVSGHIIALVSDRSSDNITSPDTATNENGTMNFYISGTEKGIAKIIAKDINSNKSFNTKLAFTTGEESLARTKIVFASEAGTVASFNLSGLSTETKVGEKQSITVTAVDASGLTVTDYTGTIQFSSTDSNATLPSEYAFLASDLGQHNFDLGFNFVTPDTQSITATDIDQSTITGTISTSVVTSYSALDQSVDYQSTYETTDYERADKFTLVSPVSGSISNNTIEVTGSGDYGKTAVIYLNGEEAAKVEIDKDNSFDYSLTNLDDDTYEIYVDIDTTTLSDTGEITIVSKVETSEVETIIIDTTPPELNSLTFTPGTSANVGDTITATVLSENGLKSVTLEINGVVNTIEESTTGGKYVGDILVPATEGSYPVNVVLQDELGNESDYRAQDTIIAVASGATVETTTGTVAETTVEILPAPTGLSSASGREEVTISWEPVSSSSGTVSFYRIYYGPSKDELFATSDTLDASTSWLITGLSGGEKYYFAVVPVDETGTEGAQSDPIVGTPLKASTEVSALKPSAPEPALATAALPTSTAETGPGTNLLIALSLIGSVGYFGVRKLAKQESF